MICPICTHPDSYVTDTRRSDDTIVRRRKCKRCGHRFGTHEYTEAQLAAFVARQRRDQFEDLRLDLVSLATEINLIVRKYNHR